uniref:Uncharacterized protein n=1 Tax=Hippocampus comes TaxID=109280 RepID=A0A3Q2YN35_HIPCM
MDGLSPQSEEEQEAARLQAQDERQQSDALMEKEIEALETEELHISANEEVVLKRLKEVERTAEDIIKVGRKSTKHKQKSPRRRSLAGWRRNRGATFAMEVSAQREQRTGTGQAGPAAAVRPETTRDGASGPSEDGRKRPRASDPEAGTRSPGEMTPERTDELGRGAADEPLAVDPLYHRPVYSAAYFGTGGPPRLCGSPARPPQQRARGNGRARSPSRQEEATPSGRRDGGACGSLPNDAKHVNGPARGAFATVKVRSEARPTPLCALDCRMEGRGKRKAESVAPTDVFHNPTGRPQPAAVTMIFMGYENAPDDEEADCHAELVTVGCSDNDDDDKVGDVETKTGGELLSYHPEGCKSKVFRPEAAKSRKAVSDDRTTFGASREEGGRASLPLVFLQTMRSN